MKDRIKEIMESQHMNQQSFANFIGVAPASLSSMLQERTRPTLNMVELILKKMPQVNLTWLISGDGKMFNDLPGDDLQDLKDSQSANASQEQTLDFGSNAEPQSFAPSSVPASTSRTPQPAAQRVQNRNLEVSNVDIQMKNIDKKQRVITEIRVFYDDQTWESFVPKSKM